MRRPITLSLAILGAVLALRGSAVHAQAATGQYFVLHQEIAKPAMVSEYEAAAKEFVALVTANKDKMPHFGFSCFMSPDFTYTYVAPVPNFGGIDAINGDFGALAQATGAKFQDLMKRQGAATERISEMVIQEAPELSYAPAQPRLKPGMASYYHYGFYYLLPGREAEADAVAADYVKLFKAKGVTNRYTLYKAVMGPDMPLIIVAQGGIDNADFHTAEAKTAALLGKDAEPLEARALAVTRRYETREAVLRTDLIVGAR